MGKRIANCMLELQKNAKRIIDIKDPLDSLEPIDYCSKRIMVFIYSRLLRCHCSMKIEKFLFSSYLQSRNTRNYIVVELF